MFSLLPKSRGKPHLRLGQESRREDLARAASRQEAKHYSFAILYVIIIEITHIY